MKRFLAASEIGRKPTEVIPNGVDLQRFEHLDPQKVRGELDIPTDARVVIFVGNMMIPVKGHRELLKVARRMVGDTPDVWFVFVGSHREALPIHERIIMTGAVPAGTVPDYLAAADLFAFPSHSEYGSLAVLEAMAAGLPQVAYAVGGTTEQVVHEGAAQVVMTAEQREIVEWAADGQRQWPDEARFETVLRELLDDPDRRHAMGRASRRRVEELFSLTRQVARTEALYERVIAERKP